MMNSLKFSMTRIDTGDSLYCLWDSLSTYQKSLFVLWKSMHIKGIQDKITLKAIIESLESIQCFLNLIINRYELTEFTRIRLPSQGLITNMTNTLHELYHFSYECNPSLYHIRKLTSIQNIILSDLELLNFLSRNRECTNNPKSKWIASHVFNPETP